MKERLKLTFVITMWLPTLAIIIGVILTTWMSPPYFDSMTNFVLWRFGVPILIGLIVAFVSNLVIPIGRNKPLALRASLLSVGSWLLYWFIFELFNYPGSSSLEYIGFAVIASCLLILPLGLLLAIGVYFLSQFGAHLRTLGH
jgi:hypothetical protein